MPEHRYQAPGNRPDGPCELCGYGYSMHQRELSPPESDVALSVELLQLADQVVKLVLSKRRDYGSANINMTGQYGVAVRALDKVSRIINLAGADEIEHETVAESWRDLIGYGLIGLWLEEKGEW